MSQYVPRRGSYGIDAPYAFAFISFLALLELALAIFAAVTSGHFRLFSAAFFVFTVAAIYLHFTLRGKFLIWAELLDRLNLRGDERILDMGCGRGAVLLMAAQRLTTGRAVGVDLWRSFDQSGNSAIHNLPRSARAKAIDEAVRVLRRGGRLMIVDVRGTGEHQEQLIRLGMLDVSRRRPGWHQWWGRLLGVLQATKPANGN